MMFHSHLVVAAVAVVAADAAGVVPLEAATIFAAMAGSAAPDIDHPGSWLGKRLLPVSLLVSAIFGHRGATHSLLAILSMAGLFMSMGAATPWVAAFALGYLSHLFADFLTPAGVPLLWPVNRRTFSAPFTVTTGGVMEMAAVASFAWVVLAVRS